MRPTCADSLAASGAATCATRAEVLRVLAYFDIFDHPLRLDEIIRFGSGHALSGPSVLQALGFLGEQGLVRHHEGHWGLGDVRAASERRRMAEQRAIARMPKALRMSRKIASFPFVRAVFISGSLSKGLLAKDGDIDFFVITTPGRLWVARTLLVAYKKIFLLNSRRDFCVNYFLDLDHLEVEDRNRFTATEVVTLLPMYGNGTTDAFFERNAWAFRMFPVARLQRHGEVGAHVTGTKVRLERMLGGRLGETLDRWAMQMTWHYWKRKFNEMDVRSFEVAFRTRTYVSKHHPRNFQQRVLDGYDQRIRRLEKSAGIPLS